MTKQVPHLRWRVLVVLGVLSVWRLANGRLECPNKRGLCAGKGQAAMLERWRCRQRAGCNPGAAKADGQGLVAAAARKPCSSWRIVRVVAGGAVPHLRWTVLGVLGVLSVWRLAKGRLECPNKRELCAGKGQAAMLERWRPGAGGKLPRGMCRQRAGCNPGAAKADGQAWWKLPRRNWRVVGVLGVWSLANGRLECPNERGLCAGKGGF